MTRHAIARLRQCPLVTVVVHTAMAVGQCLVVAPHALGLTVATGSGVVLSCVVRRTRRRGALGVFAPLVLAAAIATVAFEAIRHGLTGPVTYPVAAALVTLPVGAALTTASVELAADRMVAGASRGTLLIVVWLLFGAATVTDAELAGLPMGRPRRGHDVAGRRGFPRRVHRLFPLAGLVRAASVTADSSGVDHNTGSVVLGVDVRLGMIHGQDFL